MKQRFGDFFPPACHSSPGDYSGRSNGKLLQSGETYYESENERAVYWTGKATNTVEKRAEAQDRRGSRATEARGAIAGTGNVEGAAKSVQFEFGIRGGRKGTRPNPDGDRKRSDAYPYGERGERITRKRRLVLDEDVRAHHCVLRRRESSRPKREERRRRGGGVRACTYRAGPRLPPRG